MGSLLLVSIRRLRAPLIVLITVFAVATAGFALIPGIDSEGTPWRPTIFEAFYFVTYTATTIGFGELPYAFTDTQRMWVTVTIYSSVIGWAYLLGSLLGLMQDKGFQAALVMARFARAVRRLREPFYLLCGLGETGYMVAAALDRMGQRFVALDRDETRVANLDLGSLVTDPPAMAGDVTSPETLRLAGLARRECVGVLALTADDRANVAIAVAARLLHPGMRMIARATTPEATAAMETCSVAEIINPYREFAERLAVAIRAPDTHRLLTWLTDPHGARLSPRLPAPPGRWIVCGYGRFGTEVTRTLREGGFHVTVVDPDEPPAPGLEIVHGLGSDHDTLTAAGIAEAEGLVAASDDDVANLAMAMAARRLKPGIFVIARQNRVRNRSLFEAFKAEMTMVPSEIVAHECLASLRAKHLTRFLAHAYAQDDTWAAAADRPTRAAGRAGGSRGLERDPRQARRARADRCPRAPRAAGEPRRPRPRPGGPGPGVAGAAADAGTPRRGDRRARRRDRAQARRRAPLRRHRLGAPGDAPRPCSTSTPPTTC